LFSIALTPFTRDEDVGRGARTVAHHEHGYLLLGDAALAGLAAAPARLAQQCTLAFARFEEVGLIGLGNAAQCAGLALTGQLQEAVTPAKRRAPGHLQPLGHPGNAQLTSQALTDLGAGPTFYDCAVQVEAATNYS